MSLFPYLLAIIVATVITCHFELYSPVIEEVRILAPEDVIIQYEYIVYAVFYLVTIVFFPVALIVALYPPFTEKFKASLVKSLLGQ